MDALGPNNAQLLEIMGRYNFTSVNSMKTHIQGSCLDHVYLSLNVLKTSMPAMHIQHITQTNTMSLCNYRGLIK